MDVPQVWAIAQSALPDLEARLRRGPGGEIVARRSLDAAMQAPKPPRVGLVNIFGVIDQWPSWMSDTSTVEAQGAVKRAASDPSIDCVVLNINSPGGSVAGIQELSDTIYAARQQKPIYAIANSMAASALYWVGSAASKFYAAPMALVGSIGAMLVHTDQSALNERLGIKNTYITSGKYKAEGNPDEPLAPEARAAAQKMVDAAYQDFVRAVARNRGVKPSKVLSDYGQGRVVFAKDALAAGMIDGIKTLSDLLGSPGTGGRGQPGGLESVAQMRERWEIKKRLYGR